MFKKSITTIFTVILLITAVFRSLAAEEITGRVVMEKVENRFTGNDRVADMTMTLIKSSGRRRVRKVKIWLKKYGKNNRTLMKFFMPADVRGAGFLI